MTPSKPPTTAVRPCRRPLIYTPEVLAQIDTMHNVEGISITEIAKRLEGEAQTMRRRMWTAGYTVKSYQWRGTQFTAELLDTADKLHNQDKLSIRQVANRLGCDRKTLREKMVEGGKHVRGQKDSQRARRDLEANGGAELTKEDVMEWGAHELFRNGAK